MIPKAVLFVSQTTGISFYTEKYNGQKGGTKR